MAGHRLLFVCASNVCRSPYMAAVFAGSLSSAMTGQGFGVSSRGTIVESRERVCETSAVRLGTDPISTAMINKHVSRKVNAGDVNRAHLILTATAADRSVVATTSPPSRARTFTVREALLLSDAEIMDGEIRAATVPGRAASSLRTYADILNNRRGTVELPAPSRRGFLGRRQPEETALDIADMHSAGKSGHGRMFTEVDVLIPRLASRVEAFLTRTRHEPATAG